MAINYAGQTLIRPAGQTLDAPPLVLRNPQNDNTKLDYLKNGPQALLAFGPRDYRQYYEGLTDQTGAATNYWMYARGENPWAWTKDANPPGLTPNTGDWEQGEVCPSTWLYDRTQRAFKMIYHGGNNAGPRQCGIATAPLLSGGRPGSWTRYSGNPIIPVGSAGAWNDDDVADCVAMPRDTGLWLAFARGVKNSDSKSRIGKWTSRDRGYTWTAYSNNPVIDVGTGNAELASAAPWGYIDELGRIHLWYIARDSGNTHRILYGYSDNDGDSFTTNETDVILGPNPGGDADDPDLLIGDVMAGMVDEGLLIFGCMNFSLSAYADGLGRLEGRGHYWLPCEAASAPTRPGRCFTNKVANSRVTVDSSATLLGQSVFTIYAEFKCPPHNTVRDIYSEDHDVFNKEIYLRLKTNGTVEFFYRTPTGAAFTASTARFDDGLIHWVLWIRRGAADFEMYIDGKSVATSTTNAGTDTPGVDGIAWGNWGTTAFDNVLMGWLRQSLTIKGTALTVEQGATLWNDGNPGGVLPGGVTAECWVQHGSGGAAGPDAAYGGATYGTTVAAGTKVVNAAPHEQIRYQIMTDLRISGRAFHNF
jgi:hypothetical protein